MTISLDLWTVPAAITVLLLIVMLRPYRSTSVYDFGAVFRLFWLVPILAVWLVYAGLTRLLEK